MVGIFDTGIGGLSVLFYLRKMGFEEDILYFSDNNHFPYCEKDHKDRKIFALKIATFLQDKGATLISIGCNTISSFAKDIISNKLVIPHLDVISCGICRLEKLSLPRILVLGSEVTCSSKIYSKTLETSNKIFQVNEIPMTKLIYKIEREFNNVKKEYIKQLIDEIRMPDVDIVVLGCTHFSHFKSYFKSTISPRAIIVDPSFELAQSIMKLRSTNQNNTNCDMNNFIFHTGPKHSIVQVIKNRIIGKVYLDKVKLNKWK